MKNKIVDLVCRFARKLQQAPHAFRRLGQPEREHGGAVQIALQVVADASVLVFLINKGVRRERMPETAVPDHDGFRPSAVRAQIGNNSFRSLAELKGRGRSRIPEKRIGRLVLRGFRHGHGVACEQEAFAASAVRQQRGRHRHPVHPAGTPQ